MIAAAIAFIATEMIPVMTKEIILTEFLKKMRKRMARSSSLYAVFQNSKPIAGFTVKHELITWLKGWQPEYLEWMRVYKFPDGWSVNYRTGETNTFEPFEVDIVELIKEQ